MVLILFHKVLILFQFCSNFTDSLTQDIGDNVIIKFFISARFSELDILLSFGLVFELDYRLYDGRTKDAYTTKDGRTKIPWTLGRKTLGRKTLGRKMVGQKKLGRQTFSRVWTVGRNLIQTTVI